jgi:hypothetical protein
MKAPNERHSPILASSIDSHCSIYFFYSLFFRYVMIVNNLSFNLSHKSSCNMGESHMARISKATAKKLCDMYPLPSMGREMVVAVKLDPCYSAFNLMLLVQNISGYFYLASSDTAKEYWPDVFGISLAE